MLIANGDGTYSAGALDVIMIYHNVDAGTFHPVFYEESPMPGPVPDHGDVTVVRLKSSLHRTTGFDSLEEAQENVRNEMRLKFILPGANVAIEKAIPWDGELGDVKVVQNWCREGNHRTFAEVNLASTT